MATTDQGIDGLRLLLSGGLTNKDPDLSLGGAASAVERTGWIRGMGPVVLEGNIPALRIDNVWPDEEGDATIDVDTDGNVVYTPPGGGAGAAVAIAEDESKILTGLDTSKAVRVYREADLALVGQTTANMRFPLNGVFGHKNVTQAQRLAGVTTYRAFMLYNPGAYTVVGIKLWLPPVASAQAVYSLAGEAPSTNTIQTVADELTAPTGVAWVSPTALATALAVPPIQAGKWYGIWIRRVLPAAGVVSARENMQLAINFRGV